jgi:Zn finger protein HypA/HybF involved in hydrogenase expression
VKYVKVCDNEDCSFEHTFETDYPEGQAWDMMMKKCPVCESKLTKVIKGKKVKEEEKPMMRRRKK